MTVYKAARSVQKKADIYQCFGRDSNPQFSRFKTTSMNCGHQRAHCSSPRWHEYGEPWCNDIDRGKLLIRLPELSSNSTSSHILAEQKEREKGNWFGLTMYLAHTSKGLKHAVKCYGMGPATLHTLRRQECCGFLSLKNPSSSAGIEPANLRSNGIHASHYTTEDDRGYLKAIYDLQMLFKSPITYEEKR
jgi:hypothetical protein